MSLNVDYYTRFIVCIVGKVMSSRGSQRSRRGRATNDHRLLKTLSRQVNGTACWQIQKNKQMASIPTRTSGLKVRKMFRIYEKVTTTAALSINLGTVEEGIYEDIGLRRPANSRTAVQFEIYGYRVFNLAGSTNHSTLEVVVFNPEEAETAAIPSIVGRFTDFSTISGVSNISIVYAANDRPVFSSDVTARTDLLGIASNIGSIVIVDVDVGMTVVPYLVLTRTIVEQRLERREQELVDAQLNQVLTEITSSLSSVTIVATT